MKQMKYTEEFLTQIVKDIIMDNDLQSELIKCIKICYKSLNQEGEQENE